MRKRAIEAQSLWLMLVILAIWEAEVRKIMVLDQARQTVHKTPFQPIACACHPKLHGKLRWAGSQFQASLSKKARPYCLNNQNKRVGAGGMAQNCRVPA
jgi:hypothetical protein